MEVWDAYKEDGSLAGCDLIREEPIPDGLYHLVCEVLVKHIDGSYLLMQRDFNKIGYPGMFEATAGGSAIKGETPVIGAEPKNTDKQKCTPQTNIQLLISGYNENSFIYTEDRTTP